MIIYSPCSVCANKTLEQIKNGEKPDKLVILRGELDDNGLIKANCSSGHESILLTDHPRYEILFTSGCSALINGYSNEAFATVSASLERCYEFFIRVVCRNLEISDEEFKKTWGQLSRSSERQLGAFLFLYLKAVGTSFDSVQDIAEERNKVIHKGRIVTEKEAEEHIEKVFKAIQKIVAGLLDKYSYEYYEEIDDLKSKQRESEPNYKSYALYSNVAMDGKKSFDRWLEELKDNMWSVTNP